MYMALRVEVIVYKMFDATQEIVKLKIFKNLFLATNKELEIKRFYTFSRQQVLWRMT